MFIEGNTFWANDALSLQAIFLDKGWDDPFRLKGTNRLDAFWKTDAGLVYHGWRLAGFYRGELFMSANDDAVEILRRINRKENLPVGKTFNIALNAKGGFSAIGCEISRGIELSSIINGLTTGVTVRYIKGEMIQEIDIKGYVTPTEPKTYDFNFLVDYVYDNNFLYEREGIASPAGEGYSFDFGLKYVFNEQFSAEVLFRDLLGRIYWKNVPYTTADATSEVKEYDENGYMKFRPTIRGYESFKDFKQKIPRKIDVSFIYKGGRFVLSPTINFIENRPLYWMTIGYRAVNNFFVDAAYNVNYTALSLGLAYKNNRLNIYSGGTDLKKVRTIGLSLSLVLNW